MSWVKDNERITADYCGYTVTGVVQDSRVKYGGKVQYTLILDEPLTLPWRSETVDRVLVDCSDLFMENV